MILPAQAEDGQAFNRLIRDVLLAPAAL